METLTQKEQSVKEVMTLILSNPDEVVLKGGDYNMTEWKKRINNFLQRSKDVQFYIAPPQKGEKYERYYATYKIEEGIIFFNELCPFSSSISNNGFCRIIIEPIGNSEYIVKRVLLKDAQGNEGRCNNDRANRKIMAGNSQKYGVIYSNNF